jgi:hypothetical protein
MAKKKIIEEKKSFALFDDDSAIAPVKKETKKTEVKSKKKEPTKREDKKNVTKSAKPSTSVSTSRKSRSTSVSSSSSNDTNKKKTKDTGKEKQRRTSDTKQKSKVTKRSSSDVGNGNVKAKDKPKSSSKLSEVIDINSKKSSRKSDIKAARNRKGTAEDARNEQNIASGSEEVFKQATKSKRRERTNTILPARPIQAGPKKLRDETLVGIVVDGEYLEVSPWSIKDGFYHQGFDSNFIVKYLHYPRQETKYDSIDKAKK